MIPEEFVDKLLQGIHLIGLRVTDGPHVVSEDQVVVYLNDPKHPDLPRLRVQVTR